MSSQLWIKKHGTCTIYYTLVRLMVDLQLLLFSHVCFSSENLIFQFCFFLFTLFQRLFLLAFPQICSFEIEILTYNCFISCVHSCTNSHTHTHIHHLKYKNIYSKFVDFWHLKVFLFFFTQCNNKKSNGHLILSINKFETLKWCT